MTKDAKQAAKLEKKLKILLGGYQVRCLSFFQILRNFELFFWLQTRHLHHSHATSYHFRVDHRVYSNSCMTFLNRLNKLIWNWRHLRSYDYMKLEPYQKDLRYVNFFSWRIIFLIIIMICFKFVYTRTRSTSSWTPKRYLPDTSFTYLILDLLFN